MEKLRANSEVETTELILFQSPAPAWAPAQHRNSFLWPLAFRTAVLGPELECGG